MAMQAYATTSNTEEAEVEQFYEDMQDLLELTPKKRCPFHHRGLECKSRKSRDTWKVKVKVAQLCLTLCDPMGYTVHRILQARVLEWVATPFSRGIFPTQCSNPGLPNIRWILYQVSH